MAMAAFPNSLKNSIEGSIKRRCRIVKYNCCRIDNRIGGPDPGPPGL